MDFWTIAEYVLIEVGIEVFYRNFNPSILFVIAPSCIILFFSFYIYFTQGAASRCECTITSSLTWKMIFSKALYI